MPQGRRQAKGDDRTPTRRVVLERVRVIVLLDGDEPPLGAMQDAEQAEAWIVRDEQEGTQLNAIERYAGKPGEPDAKVGTFKAVPIRSWRGGVRHEAPPVPLVQRRLLED